MTIELTQFTISEVASPPRCKSEMGVGSFQELTTQKGNPHPCLNEYHPSRLSVQR
jgi:hypothetical protein